MTGHGKKDMPGMSHAQYLKHTVSRLINKPYAREEGDRIERFIYIEVIISHNIILAVERDAQEYTCIV